MTPVLQLTSFTAPGTPGRENEDAMVVTDEVVVVVDGAGLPRSMRAGCHHSVAWFAHSIAAELHAALTARTGTMRAALATAIERVAGGHSSSCDLEAGSPSATVAAWRRSGGRLEHLVLCDATLLVVDRQGRTTAISDQRLEHLVVAAMAEPGAGRSSPAAARTAARVRVEALKNREGGFWCVGSDPEAAGHALTGELELDALSGAIACSDGAARAYELLATHTLDGFAAGCLAGPLGSVAAAVRTAEGRCSDVLEQQGHKVHDDLTVVTARVPEPVPAGA